MQSEYICTKGETSEFGRKKRNGGNNGNSHSTHLGMMIVFVFAALTLLQTTEARTGNVQRRGFKSSLLSTARGFGKRASQYDRGVSDLMTTAIGFGKRSAPLRQDIRSSLYPKELSSVKDLHDESQYEFDMNTLLRQLNEEASKNPLMIPLLLNVIRENTELDAPGYDEPQ